MSEVTADENLVRWMASNISYSLRDWRNSTIFNVLEDASFEIKWSTRLKFSAKKELEASLISSLRVRCSDLLDVVCGMFVPFRDFRRSNESDNEFVRCLFKKQTLFNSIAWSKSCETLSSKKRFVFVGLREHFLRIFLLMRCIVCNEKYQWYYRPFLRTIGKFMLLAVQRKS